MAPQSEASTESFTRGPLPVWARVALSIVLIIHVTAVFTGPWAVFSRERPEREQFLLASDVQGLLLPYMEAAHLANGYRFFAPEPGPSHPIRYELVLADGSKVESTFPNRDEQWPRLLYHRYFMLAEFAARLSGPDIRPEIRNAVAQSYGAHLAREFNAREVRVFVRLRKLPTMDEVRRGLAITNPMFFDDTDRILIDYRGAEP